MSEPITPGQRRCMIFKYDRRLEDECLGSGCGMSTVACAANRAHNGQHCCDVCRHEDE
jgi:hypothetical protein